MKYIHIKIDVFSFFQLGEGMHVVSEDFHEDRLGDDLDSLSERARRNKRLSHHKNSKLTAGERTDALTCKPLDYHQEEATRKFETNKWLQHHFGSESSRSQGSSLHDLTEDTDKNNQTTSGGNIITITMSPRPATPDDTVDAAPPGRLRRWDATTPLTSTPKAPPMPPTAKPSLFGNSFHNSSMTSEEGLDKRMVDARARLKPTGRSLNDSTDSNAESTTSNKITTNGKYGGLPERIQVLPTGPGTTFTPPMSPTSPLSPLSLNSPASSIIKDDPVYGSRFRSGTPTKFMEDPESPPPPLPTTEPPSYVGRSQSFNITSRPWQQNSSISNSNYNSLYSSKNSSSNLKKTYKSTDRLDSYDQNTSSRSFRNWPPPKQRDSSPKRDPSPPHRFRKSSPHKARAPSPPSFTVAREVSTQTGPTPIPPPRTKRKNKNKPKNTYFFGENESFSSISSNLNTSTLPSKSISNRYSFNGTSSLRPIQSSTVESTTRYSRTNNESPKIEKRYRTTKTITPVVVVDANELRSKKEREEQEQLEKRRARHYRSMDQLNDAPRSTWTSTVDPRRRPRSSYIEEESRPTTLPRKTHDESPNKSYFFGQGEPSSNLRSRLNGHSGSMINVSNNKYSINSSQNYSSSNGQTTLSSLRNNRSSVSRSHSFNVQPGSKLQNGNSNKTFAESAEEKKSSTLYRSSPYLNLRSPNLIANIARSNSIKKLNESSTNGATENTSIMNGSRDLNEEEDDKKRKVFMKGLLTNAPELYHYLHGEEQSSSEPPQLIRPPDRQQSTPSTPQGTSTPRYFTFGRELNSNRSNSISQRGLNNNTNSNTNSLGRTRTMNEENESRTTLNSSVLNNSNRKSTYNLKGGSLLYSPKFRPQQDKTPPWERRDSNDRASENEDWANKHKISSSLRNGPVLIQVRDWNTR